MNFEHITERVDQYYSDKIMTHGATARGVDWNSLESQNLRFEKLLQVCNFQTPYSINDYGCGYGALVDSLRIKGIPFGYRGFDLSQAMLTQARGLYPGLECDFTHEESGLRIADYTVASGIFNVKLQASDEEWKEYMAATVDKLANFSAKGFAFNVLTLYSDAERRRPDLYYADPLYWFDTCKRKYSRYVSLLHDYPLYEFTILVQKVP